MKEILCRGRPCRHSSGSGSAVNGGDIAPSHRRDRLGSEFPTGGVKSIPANTPISIQTIRRFVCDRFFRSSLLPSHFAVWHGSSGESAERLRLVGVAFRKHKLDMPATRAPPGVQILFSEKERVIFLKGNGKWARCRSAHSISGAASQAFGLLLVCHSRMPCLLEVGRVFSCRHSSSPAQLKNFGQRP
jgi:hypothetical protein